MQTAEEYLEALVDCETKRPALTLIEADRAAVALAVLDELVGLVAEQGPDAMHFGGSYETAMFELRNKYTAKVPR